MLISAWTILAILPSVFSLSIDQKEKNNLQVTKKIDILTETQLQPSSSQCGGLIVNSEFLITSPGFPTCPPAGVNCIYTIQAADPQICELELELVTFDLDCRAGDAIIIAGEPPFCRTAQKIKRVRFNQPRINLQFRGAPFSKGRGFVIVGRQLPCRQQPSPECGGIYSGSHIEITSPLYPNSYPGNSQCQYVIHSPRGQLICSLQINFIDFSLPTSNNCIGDHLDLGGTENICGRVLGIKILREFPGEAILNFIGNIPNGGRFRIQIRQNPCETPNNNLPGFPCDPAIENTPLLTNTPSPPLFPILNPSLNNPLPGKTNYPNFSPQYFPNCCAEGYNEQNFVLLSQGFPYIYNEPSDCLYRIYRINPNICELRIRFQYFFLGDESDPNLGCSNSYLEIEGQRFCGCQTSRIWTSRFDLNYWGEQVKILRFRKPWGRPSAVRGFVLEVQQLECYHERSSHFDMSEQNVTKFCSEGKRLIGSVCIEREDTNQNNITFSNQNYDNWERIGNSSLDANEFEDLLPTTTETFETTFNTPEQAKLTKLNSTNIEEIQERIGVLSNPGGICRLLSFGQWLHVLKKLVWTKAWCPLRKAYSEYQEISQSSGVFSSPGYPRGNNQPVYKSYRFNLKPEYCSVRISFDDFCLAFTPECVSEALIDLTTGRQFCGNTLAGREVTLPGGGELIFRSTGSGLRGFSARYDQILCPGVAPGYPENIPNFPPSFPGRPLPLEPPFICRQNINVAKFSLNINEGCNFHIIPSHPGICRLRISLQAFDLPCSQGELRVAGRKYCGPLTGHTLCFDFLPQGLDLIVSKNNFTPILRVYGEQLDCYQLTVPLQRSSNSSQLELDNDIHK